MKSPPSKTWFRVLRTMTKTAIDTLSLQRDPTLRIEFPDEREREESKSLSEEELARFLGEMERLFPQHFALTMVLAYTGLRFCHVSGLEWDDWNEAIGTLKIRRSQVRGKVGPVSRKKRAPAEYPIGPELNDILRWHRRRMIKGQAPGLEVGRMFPSKVGTLRASSSLHKAWVKCSKAAGIEKNFTPHGLRYTFNDLLHRVKQDPLLRRALLGHVTERMQHHYSTFGLDQKRDAVAAVTRLVPINFPGKCGDALRKEKRPGNRDD